MRQRSAFGPIWVACSLQLLPSKIDGANRLLQPSSAYQRIRALPSSSVSAESDISNDTVDCLDLTPVTSVRLACTKRGSPSWKDAVAEPDFRRVPVQVLNERAHQQTPISTAQPIR
jgi:hypothetical protein